MSKRVATHTLIEIKEPDQKSWTNISDHVTRIEYDIRPGDVCGVKLTLIHDLNEHVIAKAGKYEKGWRTAVKDKVVIAGVDISKSLYSYGVISTAGAPDTLVLELYCDSDTLRINGTHFWEDIPHPIAGPRTLHEELDPFDKELPEVEYFN